MPTYRQGSKGSAVRDLQNKLKAAGFDPGPIDGIYGARTAAAVRAFQQSKGLAADGVAGDATLSALGSGQAAQPAAAAGDLRSQVLEQYPQFAYLLNIPEVAALLTQAVDPNVGFSAQEFEAKLHATNWWRTTGEAIRTWDALAANDPATAAQRQRARVEEIRDIAGDMGVTLSDATLSALALESLRLGYATGSAEMRNALATYTQQAGQLSASTIYAQVTDMARRDYLMSLPEADAQAWARKIMAGDQSMESYELALRALAKGRFTAIGDLLEQGITPGEYFAPYRAAIADELEISADGINLLDPKWAQVLGVNGTDGKLRPMTITEAQRLARTQSEWKGTGRARQASAELGQSLLQSFGMIR